MRFTSTGVDADAALSKNESSKKITSTLVEQKCPAHIRNPKDRHLATET